MLVIHDDMHVLYT